jgi:hypothetical protein
MDILIAVFFTLVGVNLTVLVSAVVMLVRSSRVLAELGGYRGGANAKDMPPPTKVPSARIRIEYSNDSKDNLDGPLD